MPETLEKLRPDRDLQCYFERPSAIAAMSTASPTGFTTSGTWRQQFDWAVIEWNQHNVFEHPAFRNLPDGDLSGLTLTYEETRENCAPMDSTLFPTVEWDALRIWTREDGADDFFKVRLKDHAEPIEGGYTPASVEFELSGTITALDHIGIACAGEHFDYEILGTDTIELAVQGLVDAVDTFSELFAAERIDATIKLHYVGPGETMETSTTGANGNRLGAYVYVHGAETESWSPTSAKFSGGESPTKWRVTLDFSSLVAMDERTVPGDKIRKMRWTYAAELQDGAFERSEFGVVVSNWSVTGTNRAYKVAAPQSRRIEDDGTDVAYSGDWASSKGNFSGGTIRFTSTPDASVTVNYEAAGDHALHLGTRYAFNGAEVEVSVDSGAPETLKLFVDGEDQLVRLPLADLGAGSHTIEIKHASDSGDYFYFDFLELAVPTTDLPAFPGDAKITLATDWDTDHSLAIPPERTAWMIQSLGYHGRANHYVGALWFYELARPGHNYASAAIEFVGEPAFSETTSIQIDSTAINHLNLIGDTAESIAKAFELELNSGYTAVRAEASGALLTIYARAMGVAGNGITISASPDDTEEPFHAVVSGSNLAGGDDGDWYTDLAATPRLNRAVRDWSRAYFIALDNYGLAVTAAFSTELQHGDPSETAGIAQRYPNGDPVLLSTPALQTNFSPTSLDYWKQVHLEMAEIMVEAGVQPYLQFGEVQWWYFPLVVDEVFIGMPFYDAYTTSTFESIYSRPMTVITSNHEDPDDHPEEAEFLPTLIGAFTAASSAYVLAGVPDCRFEVLYPTDVNDAPFTSAINYAAGEWVPANLDVLKTESFTYTFTRNLDLAEGTIRHGETRGFARNERAFLVGIQDASTAWMKEVGIARSQNVESIVLWAFDQYCLIGYPTPLPNGLRRSSRQGS